MTVTEYLRSACLYECEPLWADYRKTFSLSDPGYDHSIHFVSRRSLTDALIGKPDPDEYEVWFEGTKDDDPDKSLVLVFTTVVVKTVEDAKFLIEHLQFKSI